MQLVDMISQGLNYLTYNKYVFFLSLLLLCFVAIKISLWMLKKFFGKIFKRTKTEVDDLILEKTYGPITWTLMIAGVRISIGPLQLPTENLIMTYNIIDSLLIIFVIYTIHVVSTVILAHYVKKINKRTESNFHSELIPFTNHFSKIIYAMIALVFILKLWNVNIVPLLAGIGIVGITIGLALQNTLSNVVGGIALLLDQNFNIGDEIKLDNDIQGTILDVGLRSTKIRTYNSELIIVPNNTLANSKIINYSKPTTFLRINIPFSVKPGTNIEILENAMEKKASKMDFVEKDSKRQTELIITSMNNNEVKINASFWVNIQHIKRNLAEEKLSLMIYDILKKY